MLFCVWGSLILCLAGIIEVVDLCMRGREKKEGEEREQERDRVCKHKSTRHVDKSVRV